MVVIGDPRSMGVVGLSVSQVHSKHDVDSVSNRHLSAPDDFTHFIIYGIHSNRSQAAQNGI